MENRRYFMTELTNLVEDIRNNIEVLNHAYRVSIRAIGSELIYKEVDDEKAAEVTDKVAGTQKGVERVAEILGREGE